MEKGKDSFRRFAKLWWRMDTVGSVVLLVVLGCLVASFVGFPKNIEQTVEACVYTEGGEQLSCQLLITGEATTYPFRNRVEYSIKAFSDHVLVSEMNYDTKRQAYGYCNTYRFTGIKDIQNDVLMVEMDLSTLFPEQESQRCVISAPACARTEIVDCLNRAELSEEYKQTFAWFIAR